ncbi:MAG: HDOD domain-containing protein [Desulfobacterota bacterium]|jgi:HD-like signal output (HDOD) protein|nr:HDOD domain-containing protein [Thermodesulfobacteriota bacterium]
MNLTERIIENIRDLPTLPTVYLALSEVIADPSSTAQDVSKIVACDQASAARVLRLANSVMYGFPGQIDTISRAVVVLGFDEIRNLVLSTVVMDLFSKQETVFSFRPTDFWAHSVAVGIATRLIGKACRMPREENCFVAGVLHDIGKLVFFEYAEKQYTQALDQAHKGHLSLYETEQDLLGLDHSRGGTILAENWNLPRDIQQAIRCHHTGLTGEDTDLLTAAVHMADILVRALELGFGGDDLIPRPQGEAWALLRLPPQTLSGMVPDLLRDYQEAVEIMGLQ